MAIISNMVKYGKIGVIGVFMVALFVLGLPEIGSFRGGNLVSKADSQVYVGPLKVLVKGSALINPGYSYTLVFFRLDTGAPYVGGTFDANYRGCDLSVIQCSPLAVFPWGDYVTDSNGEVRVTLPSDFPQGVHRASFRIRGQSVAWSNQIDIRVQSTPVAPYPLEGDVWPRPSGDGRITNEDFEQEGLFSAGLETPVFGLEFQRADVFPVSTRGDGKVDLSDWVIVQQMVLGQLGLAVAAGPVNSAGN